ncbi:MAG: hypothetical protein JWQ09_3196 [Segetibacter sp.]|nr:hypothetical protein [Segetibacter sp.]
MTYKIVENPETENLGAEGVIILQLLKDHNKSLYQQLKADNQLIEQIQKWENGYLAQMDRLILAGLNQSEAREIAWPNITARFM